MQFLHAVCMIYGWYVPAAHETQLVWYPAVLWYAPAEHVWQDVVAVDGHAEVTNMPALHTAHAVHALWPADAWYVFAPHALQLVCRPATSWNVTAGQSAHTRALIAVHEVVT